MAFRAVIFDLGGVVLPSPFTAFREYEVARGLPHRFISDVIVAGGDDSAWSRLERGEIGPDAFAAAFADECAAAGIRVDVTDMFASMRTEGFSEPIPVVVDAIHRIRAEGLRTAALTNNWVDGKHGTHVTGESRFAARLAPLFDTIVESALVGLRKPDPRIYALVCETLAVEPQEAVFLDDLGANLKTARAMGITTIKVDDPAAAVAELAVVLGFDLATAD